MHFIIFVRSFILLAICILMDSFPMLFAVQPFPIIYSAIGPGAFSDSIDFIVLEISLVDGTICVCELTLTLFFAVSVFTLEDITRGVCFFARTMFDTTQELSFKYTLAIQASEFAVPFHRIFPPSSKIRISIQENCSSICASFSCYKSALINKPLLDHKQHSFAVRTILTRIPFSDINVTIRERLIIDARSLDRT